MHTPKEHHLEIARCLIAAERRGAPSDVGLAEASVRAFDKLFACLAPIIGSAGVRSILVRSLKLTAAAFPELATVASPVDRGAMPADLLALLHAYVDSDDNGTAKAAEMITALSATFVALLGSLVGEGLTARILASAWPDVFAAKLSKETT